MSPRDLGEVVAFFDHINGPDRFSEILLKDILFPFGDFDPIETAREIELPDLRVEFLNELEIGLRCVSNGFEGCGSSDFEIDDIVGNWVVILIFFQEESEFFRP